MDTKPVPLPELPPRCPICGEVAMRYRHGEEGLYAFLCLEETCGARLVMKDGTLRRLRQAADGWTIDTTEKGIVTP